MEERVQTFYELHNNKWFHIMNHTLEVIKTDVKERAMIIKYGSCFFGGSGKLPSISKHSRILLDG